LDQKSLFFEQKFNFWAKIIFGQKMENLNAKDSI